MKVSLKLGLSSLIHAKTSKEVNSSIGEPWRAFSRLRTHFVRVWRPSKAILYLREADRVSLPRGMHVHGQTCVRMVSACMRMHAYACAWTCMHVQAGRQIQIPFPIRRRVYPPRFLSWFLLPKGLLKSHSNSDFQASKTKRVEKENCMKIMCQYPQEL